MNWKKEISEIERREAMSESMGGADKIKLQHEHGKLTVRERIELLTDTGSFHEIGKLAGESKYNEKGELVSFKPSNFVMGVAKIDGRQIIVSGDDFTVRGGSADASISEKRIYAEGVASELGLPHIRLIDGMGGGGSVKTIETSGRTYIPRVAGWEMVVAQLAKSPSISLYERGVGGISVTPSLRCTSPVSRCRS